MVKISPSLLASDFVRLAEEIARAEAAGADFLHVDVMDGHLVNNITVGPPIVRCIKRVARIPLDVHLMITQPGRYIPAFIEAGSDLLTIHAESEGDIPDLLRDIRKRGARAGLTVKPGTGLQAFEPCRGLLDLALVMSVEPGFGGQEFLPGSEERIAQLRQMLGENVDISVDGGVTTENAWRVRQAGASIIVAGTAVFRAPDMQAAIRGLRGS